MKNKSIFLPLSVLALLSCSTGSAASSAKEDLSTGEQMSHASVEKTEFQDVNIKSLPTKERTFYQLLVYSFADGNDDGIGDFKGIIDHLDYLVDLGIGGIWLSPILKAKSYHGYDVIDYYAINPDYEVTVGNAKYDLANLLDACHQKGIKVLMDMVLNHSSESCAWVKEHPNWYKIPDAFPGAMKDFDYDNSELRNEIKNVGEYWMGKGVDGFRLDAAKWIYNYGDVYSDADDEKNYVWWNEFYKACQGVNPDVYMVNEVLVDNNLKDDRAYYKTGMDSDLNFELRAYVNKAINGTPSSYISHLVEFQDEIRDYNANGIEAGCLSNHDIGRYNQKYNLSAAKQSLAGQLNILAPGDSYVYYGDELGLSGSTEDGYDDMAYRTAMPFSSGQTDSTKYFGGFKGNGRSTSTTLSSKTADADIKDASSLAVDYADAIKAKNRSKTLYSGKISANSTSFDQELASFITTKNSDSNTVIFNCGPNGKYVSISGNGTLIGESAYGDNHSGMVDGALYLAPYSSAVFEGSISFTSSINAGGETSITKEITPDDPGTRVNEEKSGKLTLHCAPIQGWENLNCYAWVGNNPYLGSWPGTAMQKDSNGWYVIDIAHGASNVIFNDGNRQTTDLFRPESGEYWFKVGSSDNQTGGNWYVEYPG